MPAQKELRRFKIFTSKNERIKMMDEKDRGTAYKFGAKLPGQTNQPTGPISKQPPQPSSSSSPLVKKPKGKPVVEKLNGISVPDQYYFSQQGTIAKKVFDAELNRKTKTLTLIVRIKFEFVDLFFKYKKDGKPMFGKRVYSWEDNKERKEKFINTFVKLIESRWSHKHKLYPAEPCDEPVKSYDTAIRIEPVEDWEHKVAKIHFENDFIISGNEFKPVTSTASANLHEMTLSEPDVKVHDVTPSMLHGKLIYTKNYSVAAHEFGHAIGLHHINEKAADKNQALDPYGETIEQRNDTMGIGGNIGIEDMWPFIVTIYYFTGCRWEAK